MPYGKCEILDEETKNEFGYSYRELDTNSNKPVKVKCGLCSMIFNRKMNTSQTMHLCSIIIDDKKHCFKCKTWLSVDEFSKNRHVFGGLQKVCKACFSNYDCVKRGYEKKSKGLKEDILKYFKHKTVALKISAKKKNIDFDISGDFLLDLYLKQEKRCYYTNQTIEHNQGVFQANSISVDRKNPSLGYTKDNVVLCSFAVNSFKNDMDILKFKEYLKGVIDFMKEFCEKE